ncbi:extracellular solute-binding protein [Bacillaceae bacterium]
MNRIIILFAVLGALLTGCAAAGEQTAGKRQGTDTNADAETSARAEEIILATTTSTQDSGLLDALLPAFEASAGHEVKVKVVAVGTGQALQLGKDGNADVLFVHERKSEDQFVQEGYGTYAYDVMYNRFLLAGPGDDPARVKEAASVTEAFARIAKAKAVFLSRGDQSGTHKKELAVWEASGIKPEGDWYKEVGQGMGATLQMAEELGAYTLADEATFLTVRKELQALIADDPLLRNPYGIMMVASTEKPELAQKLIDFIVGKEGQDMIARFGKDKFGKPLFVPDAKKR